MWRPEIFHEEVDGKARGGTFNKYSMSGNPIGQNETEVQLNPGDQVLLENGSQFISVKDQAMPRDRNNSQTGFVNILSATTLAAAVEEAGRARKTINLKSHNNQTVRLGEIDIEFTWSPSPQR